MGEGGIEGESTSQIRNTFYKPHQVRGRGRCHGAAVLGMPGDYIPLPRSLFRHIWAVAEGRPNVWITATQRGGQDEALGSWIPPGLALAVVGNSE